MIDPTPLFKILNMHAEEKKNNTSSAFCIQEVFACPIRTVATADPFFQIDLPPDEDYIKIDFTSSCISFS